MTEIDPELAEIVTLFIAEATGMLDEAEPKFIDLKKTPTGDEALATINALFRYFHSIKGGAASLQLKHIASLTHSAENLMDLFRKQELIIGESHIEVLLKVTDQIRAMLAHADTAKSDDGFDAQITELKQSLTEAMSKKGEVPPEPQPSQAQEPSAPPPSPAPSSAIMEPVPITAEFLDKFVQESMENFEQIEQSLLQMSETKLYPTEKMHELMRLMHSFKGNCGFMGFAELQQIAHKYEEVFEAIKAGKIQCNENIIRMMLGIVDLIKKSVTELPSGGKGTVTNLKQHLNQADYWLQNKGEVSQKTSTEAPVVAAPAPTPTAAPTPVSAPAPKAAATASPKVTSGAAAQTAIQQDIRVSLSKLDSLINLVGELVIAESMVTRCPAVLNLEDEQFERSVHHLRRITAGLQDVAMSVRMVPLSTSFRKMIRLVHDLSQKVGKSVKLDLIGEDTEVDKTVIEQIADPLVHIVRNSLDHGLEPPEERKATGKPETGTITIEARHEGGEVWIIIRDDGRGLSRDKILKKALERGLLRDNPNAMSDSQVFSFIFEPGFSTAEKVTDVSGRGVGMDVVRKNLEKLRGRIDLESKLGRGTSVILRIPLTLAVISGMLTRVGSGKYTIPLLTIRESMKIAADAITITPDGQEMIRVRDEIIPVIRLHEKFGIQPETKKLEEGILIVVSAENQQACLFADQIMGQQEVVIKGLPGYIHDVSGVSGCTILGDGEVSMILDVGAILRSSMKQGHA